MKTRTLRSDSLLLLTASIWGFAFVAQRVGMEFVGPFTFNGIRFALGSCALLPLWVSTRHRWTRRGQTAISSSSKVTLQGGLLASLALFMGASLQQIGLVYTTAGKAGFITGLYVVIVPVLGLLWGQRTGLATWIGALLATVGLYFLSVTESLTMSSGDLLELIGAFFWAGHVLVIGWLSSKMDPVPLACVQFAGCSFLSLWVAVLKESIQLHHLQQAAIPILYGGICSVGIAYTLQVIAQREAHPSHAAIILSLESLFAALGGWLILGERLSGRGLFGCTLMLAGMILSQVRMEKRI